MTPQEIFDYLKNNMRIELSVYPEGMTWPLNQVHIKLFLTAPDGKEVMVSESKDSFSTM